MLIILYLIYQFEILLNMTCIAPVVSIRELRWPKAASMMGLRPWRMMGLAGHGCWLWWTFSLICQGDLHDCRTCLPLSWVFPWCASIVDFVWQSCLPCHLKNLQTMHGRICYNSVCLCYLIGPQLNCFCSLSWFWFEVCPVFCFKCLFDWVLSLYGSEFSLAWLLRLMPLTYKGTRNAGL